MKASSGRLAYEIVFWAGVITLVVLYRGLYIKTYAILSPVFQAYTDVVLFLIGIALFLLVNYLREAIVNTFVAVGQQFTGGRPLNYERGNLQKNIQKSARRLERKGDYQGAGEAYESLELWRDAAAVYERGNLYGRAATSWQMAGNTGKAIEYNEKDGNFEAAGQLCLAEGLQDRAAKNFRIAADQHLEANQFGAAAEFYEKAHDYDKSALIFEQAHKPDRALNCYEKANNLEKVLDIIRLIPVADYHRRGPDFTRLIQRCAEQLANSGFATEGAKILEETQDLIRAAEIYASCKMWEKSAELYLKAGRQDLASAAIKHIEDARVAAEITARLAIGNSDWQSAGEQYETAGKQNQAIDAYKKARNFDAAARIYEAMGRFIMAGEMYSSGKNLSAAANAYAKAYDWRNAAECFEASGDATQAIEAYSNAGNYLKAGMLAIKMTDYARAIEYLQRIPSGSPDFQMGTAFLATAFYYQCHYDMAYELFERVMDTLPLNRDTLPVYYAFASNLESQNPKKSLGLFRQILGVDVHYSDVSDRAQKLEQIVTSMTSGFGNHTPIPSTGSGHVVRQTPLTAVRTPTPTAPVSTAYHSRPLGSSTMNSLGGASSSAPAPMQSTLSTLQPALLDGRYHLKDQLSHYGRITDYSALDSVSNLTVMVRTFPRPEDQGSLQKTIRTLSEVSHLNHPGINAVINYGETQGMIFSVTAQMEGKDLKQWVRSMGPMSLNDLKIFLGQVLSTLSYVHSQKLYHQNLRPEMIFINGKVEERIVITGFGSPSRQVNATESVYLTVPDSDPQFLAPEQILGGEIDERTDIYAMGLILFFAITGRTPFEVKRINDTQEIARMQVQVSLTRPSTIRATLPSSIDEVFLKCVSKSPAARYQSAQELLKDINNLQTNTTI